MTKVIAVDSGKYATKSVYRDGKGNILRASYRTKMDPTNEIKSTDRNSFVVQFEGKSYLIGQEAETINFDKSKALLIHKLATYASICRYVDDGESVILAVGCPLSIFQNVEERHRYQAFMGKDKDVRILLNGEERYFTLEKVIVCPESSGIIYQRVSDFKQRLVGIVDIGGLNTNCCVYHNLTPIKSTSFTTNLGANILTNELKQLLNSNFPDANLQDWQMEDIIKKGFIKSNRAESEQIIKNFLQTHIRNVINEMTKKGWDVKNIDLIFVGGGSKLLESEIKQLIEDADISSNAEWDNVEGFLKLGLANAKK